MSVESLVHRVREAAQGQPPHPALLLLHGLGSHEGDMMMLAPYVDSRLFVISARAPMAYRGGGYTWYDLEREGPGLGGSSIQRSLTMLRAFIEDLGSQYPIDDRRLLIGGFSMGAAMAGAFSLLNPDRVVGTVMASGYLPPDAIPSRYRLADVRNLPIFQAHGTGDAVVPLTYAHQTRDYLRLSGVDLTYREYAMGHEVHPQELKELVSWLDDRLTAIGQPEEPASSR